MIPDTAEAPFLRTYFDDDLAWRRLCELAVVPNGDFAAYITPIDDRRWAGLGIEELVAAAAQVTRSFLLVADRTAQLDPEHPILVVDLSEPAGRSFRVIPAQLWNVENNLSLANLDFEDFANNCSDRGIFHGF